MPRASTRLVGLAREHGKAKDLLTGAWDLLFLPNPMILGRNRTSTIRTCRPKPWPNTDLASKGFKIWHETKVIYLAGWGQKRWWAPTAQPNPMNGQCASLINLPARHSSALEYHSNYTNSGVPCGCGQPYRFPIQLRARRKIVGSSRYKLKGDGAGFSTEHPTTSTTQLFSSS